MIIRKKYKFKGTHIVRNCSSERCRKSIHSHNYEVEVFFTAKGLDNGYMVMDFGLTKGTIKDLIGSFDNSYTLWDKESTEFKEYIKGSYTRIVTVPISPSAESYSLMILAYIDAIIKNTVFANGEESVEVTSVRVHETLTGYAESFREDLERFKLDINDIKFTFDIIDSWSNKTLQYDLQR